MSKQGRDAIAAGTRIGKYEIVRLLGAGGMGAVYEGVHVELKKRVAIKTLHPELALRKLARQRFLREGEAASRIRHPHVVDVTDVDTHDGVPYLVMEFLEGLDLKQHIVQKGPMSATETVDLLLPAIAAVAAGHDEGVIHRDLKPHNIFMAHTRTGAVIAKVLDFGVSKLSDPSTGGPSLTGTAAIMGTVAYMSPEQAKGAKFVDGRTDQYALALILYECLTGKRPHRGENTLAVLRQIGDGSIDPPSMHVAGVPPEMEAVILKGLSVKPENRFPSLYTFGRLLLPFASERVRAVWGPTFDREPSEASSLARSESSEDEPGGPPAEAAALPAPVTESGPAGIESEATALGTVPLRPSGSVPARPAREATPVRMPARSTPVAIPARESSRKVATSPARPSERRVAGTPVATPAHEESVMDDHAPDLALPDHVPARPVAPKSRGPVGLGLALAGAVAAFGAVLLIARRGDKPPPVAPATVVHVELTVTPREAEIVLDGVPVGRGTLTRDVPITGEPHTLRLSAPGYEAQSLGFQAAPPPASITLTPARPGQRPKE